MASEARSARPASISGSLTGTMVRMVGLAGIVLLAPLAEAGCGRTTSSPHSNGTRDRPNFVIIVADDVAWDDIGAFGHPTIRTPNLDALARSGLRFAQAFLTTSSCSRARCSILTGRYPHSTGAAELHEPLPSDQVTFVEKLKEAGYYMASAGKWHLGTAALTRFDRVRREAGATSGAEFWLPTIRELAGLPIPKTVQGVSLAPVLRDPAAEVRSYVVAEQNRHDYTVCQRALRTKTLEYVRNFYPDLPETPPADTVRSRPFQIMERLRDAGGLTPLQMNCFIRPRPPEELYDVVADPDQSRNLAEMPDRRAMLRTLSGMLDRWQMETEDAPPRERRPDEYDRETGLRLPGVAPRGHAVTHPTD